MNRRLRGALLNAELTPARLAELVEVDVKTVQRWLTEDRMPYPVTRHRVARVLDQEETFLWPNLLVEELLKEDRRCGLAGVWATRTAISSDLWHELFTRATQQLDILVYAGSFLTETLDLADVLRVKAGLGTRIRVLVGDPNSAAVRARAGELDLPWLPERCRTTAASLQRYAGSGVCVRPHGTTLYASHFRFDNDMLINVHAHGVWASQSPVYRIGKGDSPLFAFYADAFDRVWVSTFKSMPRFDRSQASELPG